MSIPLHPWGAFLNARAECIDWLVETGHTPEQIARLLSMDAVQVALISQRNRKEPLKLRH